MSSTSHFSAVRPNLIVSDLEQSLKLYQDLLHFNIEAIMGEPPNFALIGKDGVSISLTQHSDVYDVGDAGVNIYIDVVDVEALYEFCKSAEIEIAYDLSSHPWGMTDFTIVDRDGHKIAFGEKS